MELYFVFLKLLAAPFEDFDQSGAFTICFFHSHHHQGHTASGGSGGMDLAAETQTVFPALPVGKSDTLGP